MQAILYCTSCPEEECPVREAADDIEEQMPACPLNAMRRNTQTKVALVVMGALPVTRFMLKNLFLNPFH